MFGNQEPKIGELMLKKDTVFGQYQLQNFDAFQPRRGAICDPRMLEALVDCDPFIDVDGEHTVNEVESWVTNAVPIWRWIIKTSHLDLLGHSIRVLSRKQLIRKRGKSTKTDVEHNTKGPDIDISLDKIRTMLAESSHLVAFGSSCFTLTRGSRSG